MNDLRSMIAQDNLCRHCVSLGKASVPNATLRVCVQLSENGLYHILSVGGGGMLTASVPESSWTSTASSRGVLDISSIFFFMYSFSVAFWKYFDLAILSTNLKILLLVRPPAAALREAKYIFHQVALIYFKQHLLSKNSKRWCFI